ncbi:hypothetical protein [Devosia sp. 1635]|uniref:hypothetical protein n=1 Tax=Devosia sp. 1635 TaxID=2726066 RepID=UPI0015672A19|nr:hypothetical protein [Devosia sp. 1635]
MGVASRIEPIGLDIALIISEELSVEARGARLAEFAQEQIDQVRIDNAKVIGQVPDYEVTVDGRRGAPISSVRGDGVIVAEFDLLLEVFAWIGAQLVSNSPVRSGLYSRSHVFFAGGVEVDPAGVVPEADEYVFLNAQPYARKIEKGLSAQAPDGVYQAVAIVANRRFGNIARVSFGYREMATGAVAVWAGGKRARSRSQAGTRLRQPAIIIRLGR